MSNHLMLLYVNSTTNESQLVIDCVLSGVFNAAMANRFDSECRVLALEIARKRNSYMPRYDWLSVHANSSRT